MSAAEPPPVELKGNAERVRVGLDSQPESEELKTATSNTADRFILASRIPSALHAIAWSTGAAVLLGFATTMGRASTDGVYSALGLTALTPPPIDQTQSVSGVALALQVILMGIAMSIIARVLYFGSIWIISKLPELELLKLPQRIQARLWWIAIVLLIADAILMNQGLLHLSKTAENLLFKSTSDIGDIWTHVIFEEDRDTATNYELLFCLGTTSFFWLSWWLLRHRFKNLVPRTVFATYAVTQLAGMLLGFAFLHGVASTVQDFPAIALSGISQTNGHFIPILLGQDDKMFAILVLQLNDQNDAVKSRYVLYLPRSEVKWMTVFSFVPLYKMSKLNDLKRLAEQVQSSNH
jgi:hypothetical protein